MSNDDRPSDWVEQIGDKVPVNDDVDKQHGRTLGKLESAASSRQTDIIDTELEGDKYEGLDKEGEHKQAKDVKNTQPEYDRDTHEKKLAEAEAERDRRAIKDYENRASRVRVPELDQVDKNLLNRVNGITDRATSYIDDISRNLGRIGPFVSRAAGIIGIFYPESTIDEETEQRLLREWEEKQQGLEEQKLHELEEPDNIGENSRDLIDKLNAYHGKDEIWDDREQDIELDRDDFSLDEYTEEMDGPDFGDFD